LRYATSVRQLAIRCGQNYKPLCPSPKQSRRSDNCDMRLRVLALLPVLVLISGCTSDPAYVEPPPPPPNPAAIDVQTKALGPTTFIPAIKVKDNELKLIIRLTFPNPMNRRDQEPLVDFPVVHLDIRDSRGQPLAALTETNLEGGTASIAAHASITRTF